MTLTFKKLSMLLECPPSQRGANLSEQALYIRLSELWLLTMSLLSIFIQWMVFGCANFYRNYFRLEFVTALELLLILFTYLMWGLGVLVLFSFLLFCFCSFTHLRSSDFYNYNKKVSCGYKLYSVNSKLTNILTELNLL